MSLGYRKGLISSQVDGATLTAAARASCLPAAAKKTLEANFFDALGMVLIARLWGRISCAAGTPGTARFDLTLGGTVVFDGLAVPLNTTVKTNVPFEVEIMLTLRALGSAANFMGAGKFISEAVVGSPLPSAGGSGAILLPYNTAPVVGSNFDSTAAQQVDMGFTQNVATGSLTVHQFMLEAHRWE